MPTTVWTIVGFKIYELSSIVTVLTICKNAFETSELLQVTSELLMTTKRMTYTTSLRLTSVYEHPNVDVALDKANIPQNVKRIGNSDEQNLRHYHLIR